MSNKILTIALCINAYKALIIIDGYTLLIRVSIVIQKMKGVYNNMAYRNMKQTAEQVKELMLTTKYLQHYALNIDELCELKRMCIDGKSIDAILTAFDYGFMLGARANERKRIPVKNVR